MKEHDEVGSEAEMEEVEEVEDCTYYDEEEETTDEEESEMEDVSEVEDCTNYEESTDDEESEEEDPAAIEEYFQSKDETLIWSSIPPSDGRHMLTAERAERETSPHGPTAYSRSRINDTKSTFYLFLPKSIEEVVLNMTNKEGKRVYGNKWRKMDPMDLQAYVGLLILAGVYRSSKEATASLWHAESGRAIFRATMTLKMFHKISRVIRFDDKDTRADRRARDKLAPIRDVWDKWVSLLPLMYDPGTDVIRTAESLYIFRRELKTHLFLLHLE